MTVDALPPYDRGRIAFWNAKPVFSNPHIDQSAKDWRDGWLEAEASFHARGGTSVTPAALEKLRPFGIPKRTPYRKQTKTGAGRVHAQNVRARGGVAGWY